MSLKHGQVFCDHCNRAVLTVGSKPNHLLHLALTLLTLGWWSIMWVLVALTSVGGYRCSSCGRRFRSGAEFAIGACMVTGAVWFFVVQLNKRPDYTVESTMPSGATNTIADAVRPAQAGAATIATPQPSAADLAPTTEATVDGVRRSIERSREGKPLFARRRWSLLDGGAIEGRLSSFGAGKVKIVDDQGMVHELPVSALSAADATFIQANIR